MHNLLQGSALKYRAPASTHSSAIEEAAAVCVAPPGVFFPPVTVAAVADAPAWPPADSGQADLPQDDLLRDDCSEPIVLRDFRAVGDDHSAPAAAVHDSVPQAVPRDDCSAAVALPDFQVADDRSALAGKGRNPGSVPERDACRKVVIAPARRAALNRRRSA